MGRSPHLGLLQHWLRLGLSSGSNSRVSSRVRRVVGIPTPWQARRNFSLKSRPSSGSVMKRPSVSSIHWGAIFLRCRFFSNAFACCFGVRDHISPPTMEEPMISTPKPRRQDLPSQSGQKGFLLMPKSLEIPTPLHRLQWLGLPS